MLIKAVTELNYWIERKRYHLVDVKAAIEIKRLSNQLLAQNFVMTFHRFTHDMKI